MEPIKRGMKLGKQTGSFFNWMMSKNQSIPVVGAGATILLWTDRHAYEVIEVNEKEKSCVIQRYAPTRLDKYGMSDSQDYEYKELTQEKVKLYYKWGGWKSRYDSVTFTDDARKKYGEFGQKLHDAYKAAGGEYRGAFISTLIPGLTKPMTTWIAVNVLFGVRREYYDYSF
jgi:hypothetical protein